VLSFAKQLLHQLVALANSGGSGFVGSFLLPIDYFPIPKISLYRLVNSLKFGPTISGFTTR
jgi:hypothetical protein